MKKVFTCIFLIFFALISFSQQIKAQSVSLSVSKDYVSNFENSIFPDFVEKALFDKSPENIDFAFLSKYLPLYLISSKKLFQIQNQPSIKVHRTITPNVYSLSFNDTAPTSIWNENYEQNNLQNSTQINYEEILFDPIQLSLDEAIAARKNKDYIQAKKILNKILQTQKDNIAVFFELANISYEINDYKNALYYYFETLKINPYNAVSYLKIAQTLEKMKKTVLALKYYKICLEIDSDEVHAQNALKRLNTNLSYK